MVVLNEWVFQGLLIGLLGIIAFVGAKMLTHFFKEKKKTKRHDHIVAVLLSAFCIATYFSMTQIIPQAYQGDLVVSESYEQQVEKAHVRFFTAPMPFKINEYERQPTPLSIELEEGEGTLMMQTEDFTNVAQFAAENQSFIRADRSINMVQYYNQVIQPVADELIADADPVVAEDIQTFIIEELSATFPEHQFYNQES